MNRKLPIIQYKGEPWFIDNMYISKVGDNGQTIKLKHVKKSDIDVNKVYLMRRLSDLLNNFTNSA
jgi:hypothetical protein